MVRRGEVWEWRSAGHGGPVAVLVVSSDVRNQVLSRILACPVVVHIELPLLPRTVQLGDGEPVHGSVLCDFIYDLDGNELIRCFGELSKPAIAAVDEQLIAVLDLPT